MSNHKTLKALFIALHGSLPYEYDEKYVNGVGTEDTIAITKNDTDRIIYITENMPDDNAIFDVVPYNDIYDDDPTEIYQWDADDQDLTLTDLITYIEKNL